MTIKWYANLTNFKPEISNCIITVNTGKQKKLDSLLNQGFQLFYKVHSSIIKYYKDCDLILHFYEDMVKITTML